MTDPRAQTGANGSGSDGPPTVLVRPVRGGFHIETRAGETIRLEHHAGRLQIDGPEDVNGWVLRRSAGDDNGLVLEIDDEEAGRTSSIFGGFREANLYYVLLGDGRLFRIALGEPRGALFELRGWETAGAYLNATPDDAGWRVTPAPAGSALPDLRALMILFAAEILDSEGSLGLPLRGEPRPSED